MPAVVGNEHDHGVLGESVLFERFTHPPNAIVHRFDHGRVGGIPFPAPLATLELLLIFRHHVLAGTNRRVHIPVAQVDEKWVLLIILNKFASRGGEILRNVDVPIKLLIESGTQSVGIIDIESLPVWAKVPLAKVRCLVTHFFDNFGNRNHRWIECVFRWELAVTLFVSTPRHEELHLSAVALGFAPGRPHMGAWRIHAGHNTRPRGHAVRSSRISGVELHPRSAERIDMRRLIEFRPIVSDVSPAKVVGHDVNDIWSRWIFREERSGRSYAEDQRRKEFHD